MDIVVLLKQVPDTETKIKVDSDGKSLDTGDIKWIINPYDEYAVEAALRLQDSLGAKVTILSMGPERVVESIRTALAMGADRGVLINDPTLEGSDSLGVARFGVYVYAEYSFSVESGIGSTKKYGFRCGFLRTSGCG